MQDNFIAISSTSFWMKFGSCLLVVKCDHMNQDTNKPVSTVVRRMQNQAHRIITEK